MGKHSSPATDLLEGPFIGRSSRFQSNSFRMGGDCYGSFRSTGNSSPEAVVPYGALVVSKKGQRRDRGILGFWRKRALKGERGVVRGSYVFPSSVDRESDSGREREDIRRSTTVKITRVRRIRSSPNLSHAANLRPLPKGLGNATLTAKAQSFGFFQGGGLGSDDDPPSPSPSQTGDRPSLAALEDKEEPQCLPGLRQYETMAVLRPNMLEDQRLALTQK
ncbi:hypothetical protein SLEP1_g57257 [Rubroshorea leprosula]|uniref:Uncharacterized protein n=1 Tax=Rubroshorea leprosula TaxID=152421 RepID=A0AAV5ML56_9ROSI|nr:hypothetical protein SLEP1_g57257 [Rubroshorea leprosula]